MKNIKDNVLNFKDKLLKDKRLKDKKIIALVVVLLLFTITYFVSINSFSYAFSPIDDQNDAYKITSDTIKKAAISYGENHKELFKDSSVTYIKVQDLIDNKILAANKEGNIVNPINNENMNTQIIKIRNDEGLITAEFD